MYDKVFLGGAFDPPTKGHTATASYIVQQGYAKSCFLLPCYRSRFGKEMSDPNLRLSMCVKSIVEEIKRTQTDIMVSPFEIIMQSSGKTMDIAKSLKCQYGNNIAFIIGLDNALIMHKWHDYKNLLKSLNFIVVNRQSDNVILDENLWFFQAPHIFVNKPIWKFDASSNLVRKLISEGKEEESLQYINESVLEVIRSHNLYV